MSPLILYFHSLKSLGLNIINVLSHILQIIYLINHLKWFALSPIINNFLFFNILSDHVEATLKKKNDQIHFTFVSFLYLLCISH